jgi:hypothetical protein
MKTFPKGISLPPPGERAPKKKLMWVDEVGEADSVFTKIEYMKESDDDEPPPPPKQSTDDDEDDGLSTPMAPSQKKRTKVSAPSLGLPLGVKKMETKEFAESARPDEDAGGYGSAINAGMMF